MYQKNEIVSFNLVDEIKRGIIKGQEGEYYHIKGLDGRTYFKREDEIIEGIGKAYRNEVRINAEGWQLDKSKGATYEDSKEWASMIKK